MNRKEKTPDRNFITQAMSPDTQKIPEDVSPIYDGEICELSYTDHTWNSHRRLLSRSVKKDLSRVGFCQVKQVNGPLNFRGEKRSPLNHLMRTLFTLFPFPFLSASASGIATKISTEEP